MVNPTSNGSEDVAKMRPFLEYTNDRPRISYPLNDENLASVIPLALPQRRVTICTPEPRRMLNVKRKWKGENFPNTFIYFHLFIAAQSITAATIEKRKDN